MCGFKERDDLVSHFWYAHQEYWNADKRLTLKCIARHIWAEQVLGYGKNTQFSVGIITHKLLYPNWELETGPILTVYKFKLWAWSTYYSSRFQSCSKYDLPVMAVGSLLIVVQWIILHGCKTNFRWLLSLVTQQLIKCYKLKPAPSQ